jgi:ATP-dependent HslUV protease subunit HslV
MSARQIAEGAMKIASEICVYTNDDFNIEEL